MAAATTSGGIVPLHCDGCQERLGEQVMRMPFEYSARRDDGSAKYVNSALHFCTDCVSHMMALGNSGSGGATVNKAVGQKKVGGGIDVSATANATADKWLAKWFGKVAQRTDPETKAMLEGVFDENVAPRNYEKLMRRQVRFLVSVQAAMSSGKAQEEEASRTTLVVTIPQEARKLLAERLPANGAAQQEVEDVMAEVGALWLEQIDTSPPSSEKMGTLLVGASIKALFTKKLGPLNAAETQRFVNAWNNYVIATHALITLLGTKSKGDFAFSPTMRTAVENAMRLGVELDRLTAGRP